MRNKADLLLVLLCYLGQGFSSPVELKDEGEGLTGPEPSIVGSVDKVLQSVNQFDQFQCIQKMICQYMGSGAGQNLVSNAVSNHLGPEAGQLAQSGLNQFVQNPSQFATNLPGQIAQNPQPIISAVTAQLDGQGGGGGSGGLVSSFLSGLLGGGSSSSGQNQFGNQFNTAQFGNQFANQFGGQVAGQFSGNQFGQFNQFGQSQFNQFGGNKFSQNQFGQNQFSQNQFNQNQFSQNQFSQNQFSQNQFSQNQFNQNQNGLGSLAALEGNAIDSLAGAIAGLFGTNRRQGGKGRTADAEEAPRTKGSKDEAPERRSPRLSRNKRQSSMHGQAIKMMQTFGLDKMAAYPYVRAAIIGHANKQSPESCRLMYDKCPDSTDQLLNYLNNHNGGVLQTAVPTATNEVGSLFPGIASILPSVAASTIGDLSSGSADTGLMNGILDNVAGMIASAMGRKK